MEAGPVTSDVGNTQSREGGRPETNVSLECVVLVVFGLFALLFGLLLFGILAGDLPYTPDSTYGLFLILVSFQMITMGRTPFGDFRRSRALLAAGMAMALLGMSACFLPGTVSALVRVLVGGVLTCGGATLLGRLFFSKTQARVWMRNPGILRQLTVACALVFAQSIILGAFTLAPGISTGLDTAIVLVLYGSSCFHLAWCLWEVAAAYPVGVAERAGASARSPETGTVKTGAGLPGEVSLPLSQAILILLGMLLVFLGGLLFPVFLGLLPFSPDGQFGVMLTIMAIQMMALGDTPLGRYRRSVVMMVTGGAFAALGILSSIVPGLLTGVIQVLLGVLNISSGALSLAKLVLPAMREWRSSASPPVSHPPVVRRLTMTQTVLSVVSIGFGLSMLIPRLVPGPVIAGILIANGILLFCLASFLRRLEQLAPESTGGTA